MKKRELVALLAAILANVGPIFAQAKFQIVEIDQALTNPDQFLGKVIALHGIISSVTSDQKTFTVLGFKSGASEGANTQSVSASVPAGTQPDLPVAGRETVLIGEIAKRADGIGFIATQVFTNRSDVQQLLTQGSLTRAPGKRPGDNLGRDAHRADISR